MQKQQEKHTIRIELGRSFAKCHPEENSIISLSIPQRYLEPDKELVLIDLLNGRKCSLFALILHLLEHESLHKVLNETMSISISDQLDNSIHGEFFELQRLDGWIEENI